MPNIVPCPSSSHLSQEALFIGGDTDDTIGGGGGDGDGDGDGGGSGAAAAAAAAHTKEYKSELRPKPSQPRIRERNHKRVV